ncbi:aminotransferase class V-fold PLP-dependent enzyme [Spirillospora sp. CA-294931]|uniref:aminotransferase class V-fold PLP-dependent enzyme n=1 Tax=Spirillospora sp. CA-294931 TaxID=3240042 RepID=UPI003D8B45B9
MLTETPTAVDLPRLVRPDFPLLDRRLDGNEIVYLDNAATSLKPSVVVEEMTRYYTEVSANIHRGRHRLSETASAEFEGVRQRVAAFAGVRGDEVVFTLNTTEALNLVASGLGLGSRDLVLVPFDGHHSNLLPWRRHARTEPIPVDSMGCVDLDAYEELLRRRPRVVALGHCSNVTGVYAPVTQMASMARSAGAVTVLDAAQSVPHRRPELDGVDFVAFSAHKMLGPTGVGVLCGTGGALERLDSRSVGGGTVDWVDLERYELRRPPHRLEAGTPNIGGVYGLGAALGYLDRLGFDALAAHDRALAGRQLGEALSRPALRIVGPTSPSVDRSATISLAVPGVSSLREIARIMSDSYGIMCRSGHLCAQPLVDRFTDHEVLRISAYVYNDEEQIARAFAALDEILPTLGAVG